MISAVTKLDVFVTSVILIAQENIGHNLDTSSVEVRLAEKSTTLVFKTCK